MEGTVEHYMGLPYTVELKPNGKGYRASVKELPGCEVTANASEGVGELWGRLKEAQRARIEELLEFGDDVPEPASADVDPFWEKAADDLDEKEVGTMLYRDGVTVFPLRVLAGLWLQELQVAGLPPEAGTPGTPSKRGTHRLDQTPREPGGDLRPVRLGSSRQRAWVAFEGPRTGHGYREVEILDQPPLPEAALVAALTILETSTVLDTDFERLRRDILKHVQAHPKLEKMGLRDLLMGLPLAWFAAEKVTIDQEAQGLSPADRKRRFGQSWKRWKRNPLLWKRSMIYSAVLLRHFRSNYEANSLVSQLELLDGLRKRINKFLDEQRKLSAYLEYRTPKGLPKPVDSARDQIKAAVLKDVGGLLHLDIAAELGLEVHEDRYSVDMKIPQIGDLVRDGRTILDQALGPKGWHGKAEQMRSEAERYRGLSEEEKAVEALAEATGWSLEDARDLYRTNPEMARFLATPL